MMLMLCSGVSFHQWVSKHLKQYSQPVTCTCLKFDNSLVGEIELDMSADHNFVIEVIILEVLTWVCVRGLNDE